MVRTIDRGEPPRSRRSWLPAGARAAHAQQPGAGDFQKVTLDDNTQNPMELDIAPDGRVFYIERDGRLMIWKPDSQQTVTAGTVPVTRSQENGLLGLTLAPDFAFSKWVYLFYSQLPDNTNTQVVSRFKVNGDTLDLSSEQKVLTFTHQRGQCCHSGGSMYFGPDGSLFIATGDNTNPFDSGGYNPIDERAGRSAWDAQRTSANTNDLNGKILRIKPMEIPLGAPGVGTTYTIPTGNLFQAGAQTRPEIFGMGFRNPFRITVDPETGWVLSADYGPDAGTTNANRGPQGSVEYNVLPSAGNYGWPYCIRENTAYNDYNFETSQSGAKYDCANPVNDSPNNTGLTNLPPARGATAWMGFQDTDPRFRPDLGTGGAPMGGPRYHFDATLDSDRKFPAYYDDKWFIAEWNNGWIKTADLDGAGAMTNVDPFALGTGYRRPMDLDFGPDGALYVIEWGSGFGGDNADSGIYRIDYVAGDKAPIAEATASVTNGLAPLAVQFNSTGSRDPENGPDHLRLGLQLRRDHRLHRPEPQLHLHHQRRLHGQADGQGPGRPDRRREHPHHGRQPRPRGDDRDAAQRQARLLHGQGPVQDLGHRSRGRDDRLGHLLQRPRDQGPARP